MLDILARRLVAASFSDARCSIAVEDWGGYHFAPVLKAALLEERSCSLRGDC